MLRIIQGAIQDIFYGLHYYFYKDTSERKVDSSKNIHLTGVISNHRTLTQYKINNVKNLIITENKPPIINKLNFIIETEREGNYILPSDILSDLVWIRDLLLKDYDIVEDFKEIYNKSYTFTFGNKYEVLIHRMTQTRIGRLSDIIDYFILDKKEGDYLSFVYVYGLRHLAVVTNGVLTICEECPK